MKALLHDLAKSISRVTPLDGGAPTPVESVYCSKFSVVDRPAKRRWTASVAIVAQGTKEISVGRQKFRAEPGDFSITLVDLPVTSRIAVATKEKPFYALLVRIDPKMVSEAVAQFETGDSRIANDENSSAVEGGPLFMGRASEEMLEASVRLAKLFQNPRDAAALGPLVIREILYHVLKGPDGAAVRRFFRSGTKQIKIASALHDLKAHLADEIDVEALAKSVNMSRAVFFRHFKDVAAMSPIQYQKRLRLLEAQRLMRESGETAESAAYRVGYKSPSQFSREYSRMFGVTPARSIRTRR